MKTEEFDKLKYWLDAELTMLRVWLALILGYVVHKKFIWIILIIYIAFSLIYAGVRLSYVESKHKGYTALPRIK